jgi:hypothetical protein
MSRSRVASIIPLLLAAACGVNEPIAAPLLPDDTADRAVVQARPLRVPKPKLVLDSTTAFFGNNYDLTVTNWVKFPEEMFVAAPELPACGLNARASRSYVDVFDSNGTLLNSFCSMYGASSLESIWVNAPQLPVTVYIVIWDRLTNATYKSNSVKIPAP